MIDWGLLIEGAIASVLPDEYARFRRPVLGALTTFLEHLPASHQEAVLADQAALPPAATASERLFVLARSCPALHKLGKSWRATAASPPNCGNTSRGWNRCPPPPRLTLSGPPWRRNSARWTGSV